MEWFEALSHPVQALIASLFTWAVTAAGAGMVFLIRQNKRILLDLMLGTAAGVMIAASFWSLLSPAIELSQQLYGNGWKAAAVGFIAGGVFLFAADKTFDRLKHCLPQGTNNTGGLKRCILLVFSITLHNIPEGMAIGVAFGSLQHNLEGATLGAACLLALGIGLQNFPEGSAVSLPLRREGLSPSKSFFWGQLSGMVEPLAALAGAFMAVYIRSALPVLLSFAAGAMIYVVVEELIPESQSGNRPQVMALFTLVGFTVMMIMDVALG
jgi:ZIP family zinc transporter